MKFQSEREKVLIIGRKKMAKMTNICLQMLCDWRFLENHSWDKYDIATVLFIYDIFEAIRMHVHLAKWLSVYKLFQFMTTKCSSWTHANVVSIYEKQQ